MEVEQSSWCSTGGFLTPVSPPISAELFHFMMKESSTHVAVRRQEMDDVGCDLELIEVEKD